MLIEAQLKYGAVALNPHTQSNIQKLENVQHSVARFVCGDHRYLISVTDLLNQLSW